MELKKEQDKLILLEANKIRLLGGLVEKKQDIEKQIIDMTTIFDDSIQRQKDKITEIIAFITPLRP